MFLGSEGWGNFKFCESGFRFSAVEETRPKPTPALTPIRICPPLPMSHSDLEIALTFDGMRGVCKFIEATGASEVDFIELILPQLKLLQASLSPEEVQSAGEKLRLFGLERCGPTYQSEGAGVRTLKKSCVISKIENHKKIKNLRMQRTT